MIPSSQPPPVPTSGLPWHDCQGLSSGGTGRTRVAGWIGQSSRQVECTGYAAEGRKTADVAGNVFVAAKGDVAGAMLTVEVVTAEVVVTVVGAVALVAAEDAVGAVVDSVRAAVEPYTAVGIWTEAAAQSPADGNFHVTTSALSDSEIELDSLSGRLESFLVGSSISAPLLFSSA